MPVTQAQFDQDLHGMMVALNTYIAAVDAFIANPAVIDLSQEDQTVQEGLTAIQNAQTLIPPPQPPPPPHP